MHKYLRVLKKVISGDNPLEVRLSQSHWDAQFASGKWRNSEEAGQNVGVVARMILEEANKRSIKVLDVGCGSGVLGQYISHSNNITYVGTDVSEEAIKQAQERVPKGIFYCRDMESGFDGDDKFDIIVFAEVLLYCDFQKAIEVHKNHLSTDGFLIISLYQTWRTKFIWHKLHCVTALQDVYVKDMYRNISWRVRKCLYSN